MSEVHAFPHLRLLSLVDLRGYNSLNIDMIGTATVFCLPKFCSALCIGLCKKKLIVEINNHLESYSIGTLFCENIY